MESKENPLHLSQIQTHWTMVFQAHEGPGDAAAEAREAVMQRYGGAVHRYLLGITRDPDLANDLAQEFALRFLRGDFRRADPKFGRFRNFVKTSVLNLVVDHHRKRKSRPQSLLEEAPDLASVSPDFSDLDRRFLECWREELLARAWSELAAIQDRTGQPFYSVLKLRVDEPTLRSHEMAERLARSLARPVNAGWVRQTLLRARARFVNLIIGEVAGSLDEPTAEQVDEELMELGLWDYCRDRRKR